MNEMQMSERIGNIDDRLIDQAEQFGKGGRGAAGFRRGKTRRAVLFWAPLRSMRNRK